MEVITKSLAELHNFLTKKEISCVELTDMFLQHIQKTDPELKAFLTVTADEALQEAERIDEKIMDNGELGPLEGLPFALKDNLCTAGVKTTCASRILENFCPPFEATVSAKLKDAGGILVGKLNLDEFAMGCTTENSAFFPTGNPWDLTRVPGGSSGGSAAAVAARQVPFALGSDTGGSVRQPAAFCGVVGLKPTYGLVSRYGLVAFASSLDQIGPLTKTVDDNARVLNIIAGHDSRDSMSAPYDKPDYTSFLGENIKGLRIGVPKEFFGRELQAEVGEKVQEALAIFKRLGAEIEECSLHHMKYALPAYYLISRAECSSNMARFDGVGFGYRAEAEEMIEMSEKTRAEGFGPEVKRRILLGTYVLTASNYQDHYVKAQKVRTLIKEDFEKLFGQYDVLLTPTTPSIAFKRGDSSSGNDDLNHPNIGATSTELSDIYTAPVNLAGLPALTVPAGFVEGMPIGIQLIGNYFAEGILYKTAYAFEQATCYYRENPSFKGEAK